MNRSLAILPITAAISIGLLSAASAQYTYVSPTPPIQPFFWQTFAPPMGMQWSIDQQIALYIRGQMDVKAAYNLCLQLSAAVRQAGGNPGNCGATSASLRASINALNQQYQINNRAAQRNSIITQAAIQRTCSWLWNPQYSQWQWVCP